MARLFLNVGFDINTIMPVLDFYTLATSMTCLMYCIINNETLGVQFLLENKANVNITVDTRWFSALAMLCTSYCSQPNDAILQLLLEYGADYNLKRSTDNTVALHFLIAGFNETIFPTNR